jgi:hypothetical protein
VPGDDTSLVRFGTSTLAGYATNRGIELFEVYQIDRADYRKLFSRIPLLTLATALASAMGKHLSRRGSGSTGHLSRV